MAMFEESVTADWHQEGEERVEDAADLRSRISLESVVLRTLHQWDHGHRVVFNVEEPSQPWPPRTGHRHRQASNHAQPITDNLLLIARFCRIRQD